MRVKVCGLTNIRNIKICIDADVDALGFVVEYPVPVPWNISKEKAKYLMSKVPPYTSSVLVTSGKKVEKAVKLTKHAMPDVLQLHGEEAEKEVREIVKALRKERVRVVKVLPIEAHGNLKTSEIIKRAVSFQQCEIDALLLDSKTSEKPAGTGVSLNWEAAREVRSRLSIPMILAGGLNPINVREAVKIVRPYGVDVISGVEVSPCVKDPDKVKAFVKACKG